jgi:hypothetical protein
LIEKVRNGVDLVGLSGTQSCPNISLALVA